MADAPTPTPAGAASMLSVGPPEVETQARAACTRYLQLHGHRTSRELLADIADDVVMDHRGHGGVVAQIEEETAELLGKPAAVFLPSGTMAQQSALRVHADHLGRHVFVCHPACHLEWREGRGYQRLHGLACHPAGDLRLPLMAAQLDAVAEAPAALLLELPQRDLGGHLPPWEDLLAQVAWARRRGAAAHLDGARLWECTPFYRRSPAEIAALFDTVYVSFYKGLGALAGCCLAGEAGVVAEVADWRTRHGGTLPALWPYAASALACLRSRLPRMAAYHRHAQAIAAALGDLPGVEVFPNPPHTPMMHLLIRASASGLGAAVLELARERRIWTFSRWFAADSPATQRIELAVGDATMGFTPEEVRELISALVTAS